MSIRFAILTVADGLAPWQLRCLEQLLGVPGVEAKLLLRGDAGGTGLTDLPRKDLLRNRAPEPQRECLPLPAYIAALPAIRLEPEGGPAEELIARVRSYELDFILSFVDGSADGKEAQQWPQLLEAARWGVWRYQFGDWLHFRDGPVGFWEVYAGQPESAALLVRETSDVNAVIVLREAYLRTCVLSPAENRAQLLGSIAHWPAQLCIALLNGTADRLTGPPLSSTAPRRREPTRVQRLVCGLRILARMMSAGYCALFRHTQWNVGIVEQPIASFLTPGPRPAVHWLRSAKRSEFRADPFGIVRDGRLTILYEVFSYVTNRGTIAAESAFTVASRSLAPLPGATPLPVHIGPQPAVHLSYPYLFEVDGRLLCMPEAHEAGEVALYEAIRYPDQWRRVARLPIDKVIVDATAFRHEGNWWIAGSEPGRKGASSELHLWYAPAIAGPWLAHPANPVKIDIRSARPAGTPFYHGGALYRPAQDCSRSYGGRVTLNRVVELNPTAFHEVAIVTVEADRSEPYPEGIHTLCQVGEFTLIDGKRTVFVAQEFRRNVRHFLLKALAPLRRKAS